MFLKIECNRKIKKLNIVFDGDDDCEIGLEEETPIKTVSKSKADAPKVEKPKQQKQFLDTSTVDNEITSEVVVKPVIEEKERPVLVASEMQKMEF